MPNFELSTLLTTLRGVYPLTLPTYHTLLYIWRYFPIFGAVQLITDYYPMGKTSYTSYLNLPARFAWITMELPSPTWFLLTSLTVSRSTHTDLDHRRTLLMAIYLIHYLNRAIINPMITSKDSAPMHILVYLLAHMFNFFNPVLIGGWLGGYGGEIKSSSIQFCVGIGIWSVGFLGNLYHEKILRDIRQNRESLKKRNEEDDGKKKDSNVRIVGGRVYVIPQGGLFNWILFPHYFCEWVEWMGFAIAAGSTCTPAILFVLNEISTMLPRALSGKRWYQKKFGPQLPPNRKAVIPFLV